METTLEINPITNLIGHERYPNHRKSVLESKTCSQTMILAENVEEFHALNNSFYSVSNKYDPV